MHPSCSKCPATRFAMHLGCLQAHGKQEQKCPDGISSAHCVPGTMSDMPDRAGTGAEAQPSNNVAIQASPPSCRNNSQSSTSSLLQKRGMLLQLQNWGPVGLQNHQKESWHFQLPLDRRIPPCLKVVCWPLPQRSMQSEATTGHGDSPYYTILSDQ